VNVPAQEVKVYSDDVIQAAHSLQPRLQIPPPHLHLLGVYQHPLRLHQVPFGRRPLRDTGSRLVHACQQDIFLTCAVGIEGIES
jgi:hypothetical protein